MLRGLPQGFLQVKLQLGQLGLGKLPLRTCDDLPILQYCHVEVTDQDAVQKSSGRQLTVCRSQACKKSCVGVLQERCARDSQESEAEVAWR